MQSAQGWSKRHFDADDDEDYYRKSPPRASYEMRGDGSSTQNRRGAEEWRRGEDHYSWSPSKDKQRRGVKDDYDPNAWTPSKDTDYSQRQWKQGHDPEYPFPENTGWVPRTTDTSRDISYNQWSPREERGGGSHQEQRGRSRWDARERPRDSGWNRTNNNANNNKKDSGPKEFQSDNGWESRRRTNTERPPSDDTAAKPFAPEDDRAWEPAPSWRGNHKDPGGGGNNANNTNPNNHRQGKQGQRKHQNRNKGGKNKKQNQGGQQKQKQDWRNDDSNPNNWTRRDGPSSASKTTNTNRGRKPQPNRTPSRSRSRSRTPDSYYSRRSSPRRSPSPGYGRGRRRSPSYGRRSPSPDDRRGWGNNRRARYSRSPSSSPRSPRNYRSPSLARRSSPTRRSSPPRRSPPPRRWGRRRSPSSVSSYRTRSRTRSRTPSRSRSRSRTRSMSRSRSRSRTPSVSSRDRPRAVHRLPTASSVNDVNIPTPTGKNALPRPPGLPMRPEAAPHPQKNGKANKRKKKQNRNHANNNNNNNGHSNSFEMPPPNFPGPNTQSWEPPMASSMSHVSTSPQSQKSEILSGPSRFTPVKAAGFKPIGQASSAVKRFFPGDDDDSGPDPPHEPPVVAVSKSPQLPPNIHPHIPLREIAPLPSHYPPHQQMQWPPNGMHQLPPVEREPIHYENAQMPASVPFSPPPPERHPSDYDNRIPQPQHVNDPHYLGQHMSQMQMQEPQILTPVETRPPSPQGSKAELYTFIAQVGEGTFGKVFKARNRDTGKFVALKRIRMEGERDGFPVTAMREIKLLQSLRHNNIVRLHEMVVCQGEVHMVFEYMDHDLTGILSQSQFSFTDAHLKSLCQQMLAGLAYLHHKGVIHRDIKGSNILINNRGELKLADFGLARFYQKRRRSDYTNRVITLWYRPPELLFGTTVYGPEVDMWSAGCIMLELFTKKPVFQGNDEIHQLDVIYKIFGTPTSERWPEVSSLPWYELVKPKDVIPNRFRDLFQKWLSPAGLDLAEHLLTFNPALRATAVQALDANYFKQELPPPELPTGLATLEGEWHELETKRERAKKRRRTEGPAPSGTQ